MAQRAKLVHFQVVGTCLFSVWCDLSDSELLTVEGVTSVDSYNPIDRSRTVFFDPRYRLNDIQTEIIQMAASAEEAA